MSLLLTRREGPVEYLTLNRPDVRNAFNAEMIAELTAWAANFAKQSDGVRAVVIAGAGKAFCAGADASWLRTVAQHSEAENVQDATVTSQMFRALDQLPVPVIGRVQGAAIGGGAGLVAVADIAIASTEASFAFSEIRLGILPAVVSPYVVRKIGPARATALFVTGSRIDAKRAHEIGLVERLVEPSDLDAAVGRVLDAIVSGGPKAVNAAKRLVREVEGRQIDEITNLTVKRIAEIRVSHEGQEGLRAFLEKRDPRW